MRAAVKAFRPADGIISLQLEASDLAEARTRVEGDGFKVIPITSAARWAQGRRKAIPFVLFTQGRSVLAWPVRCASNSPALSITPPPAVTGASRSLSNPVIARAEQAKGKA